MKWKELSGEERFRIVEMARKREVRQYERALRPSHHDLEERINEAVDDLNNHRPRPVLDGRTAAETQAIRIAPLPARKRFKQEVESKQHQLERLATSPALKIAARRRAVEAVLSRYGLIQWNADVSTESRPENRT